ncbi:nickel/cobalt transporter [uncultured Rhodoblastus sp.]|uniref:nickel/cobalt transporter n=1 Tax=uncultured Rhodoblastus sp. TaxID=543037 RepID=UPI0025D459A1|nr:nickel/cobalt transporter [uncultured Rhodoblastus sp.]
MARFVFAVAALALANPAVAQFAKNPFSLGVDEGAVGHVGRLGIWLLQQQAHFYQALRLGVEAAQKSPSAIFWLAATAFGYGVFHAAGPGHGKAVIAFYMLANERALKRGLVLSGLAALLQALVAIALVGVAAVLLGLTAQKMAAATHWVEIAAYLCIAALGAWLVWRKGAAFLAACRAPRLPASSRFQCDNLGDDLAHGLRCAHCVAPDPALLGDHFSWRSSAVTVVAAGARPCSGALLVLVFAFAQGAFSIGVWATLAMAAGTALTTGALAASAVLAKGATTKILGAQTRRAEIFARLLELVAAAVVLFLGLSLLAGLFVSSRLWTL